MQVKEEAKEEADDKGEEEEEEDDVTGDQILMVLSRDPEINSSFPLPLDLESLPKFPFRIHLTQLTRP